MRENGKRAMTSQASPSPPRPSQLNYPDMAHFSRMTSVPQPEGKQPYNPWFHIPYIPMLYRKPRYSLVSSKRNFQGCFLQSRILRY